MLMTSVCRVQARASVITTTLLWGGTAAVGVCMTVAPGAKPGVRITGVLIAAVFSSLAVRARRAGIWADDNGIAIHHWVRTVRIPWGQVGGFRVGPGSNLVQPTQTLYVDLADGRSIRVQEVSASGIVHRGRSFVHDGAEALERELNRRRDFPPGPGSSTKPS